METEPVIERVSLHEFLDHPDIVEEDEYTMDEEAEDDDEGDDMSGACLCHDMQTCPSDYPYPSAEDY